MLFNDAVNRSTYLSPIIEEINFKHWWNDNDGGKTELLGLKSCDTYGGKTSAHRMMVGKREGTRLFGKTCE